MINHTANENNIHFANVIRALAMDAVEQAHSGHPGMPMGMAEIAAALWGNNHYRHNPTHPQWVNRDRFVISNGHGSMLHYALLHLTGYDITIHDIEAFRQLHSKTPGHPEVGCTVGVETTTGPLGQGIANAVGMALAEKLLAEEFNRPEHTIVDHRTWVFVGDGCLMEGISHEVCSLAGTWKLGKLTVFWDDNGISIDGQVERWFTDNTPKRFEAYGWHVISDVDGHDINAINAAIEEAKQVADKPTLICCKTVIGQGSPNKAGHHDSHGAPLGLDEVAATRRAIGWHHKPFDVPLSIYDAWDKRFIGKAWEKEWDTTFSAYEKAFPELAAEFKRRIAGELPVNWNEVVKTGRMDTLTKIETIATRKASQNVINYIAPHLPELLGGSADLTGSNLTNWKNCHPFNGQCGNYIHYGVREFGMIAVMSGLALHGGFRPFGGTFLIFSDYARNAIRMSALMGINLIYVFTHDSIGVGEDGPTHQPIEQLSSLRLIPNLDTWRPADPIETWFAWQAAVESCTRPTALILTRQNVPFQSRSTTQLANIERGGYIIRASHHQPTLVLIATGSEVDLAIQAAKQLADISVQVVSMPSTQVFDRQDQTYRDTVLPPGIPRLAIEAGISDFWRKYVGLDGNVIGIDRFGESGPATKVFEEFGFTVNNVVTHARQLLA